MLNGPNKTKPNRIHKPVGMLGTVPEGGLGDAGGKEISQLVRVQSSHATVMNFARIRTQKGNSRFVYNICLIAIWTLLTYDLASFPGLPRFFVLQFAFSIIHGSGRARKTGKGCIPQLLSKLESYWSTLYVHM